MPQDWRGRGSEHCPTTGFRTNQALLGQEQDRLRPWWLTDAANPSFSSPPRALPLPPLHQLTPSPSLPAPTGSREIRATERSGPFQIGIRYRFAGRRHCRARSPSAQAAEAEAVAAGWLTPTSLRCLGPLATTARIGSPRSRRASPGESLTRPSRRSSLRSTAATPMALKCIVFSSGDRDEVGGGSSARGLGAPRPGWALAEDSRPRAVGGGLVQVQSALSRALPARTEPGEPGCGPGGYLSCYCPKTASHPLFPAFGWRTLTQNSAVATICRKMVPPPLKANS